MLDSFIKVSSFVFTLIGLIATFVFIFMLCYSGFFDAGDFFGGYRYECIVVEIGGFV